MKVRKGFTLVELLIVVAIVATLSAAMTMSMRGATAKAKATTIAANLDLCRAAANLYYGASMDKGAISNDTTDKVLTAQMGTGWTSMKGEKNKDAIYYVASTDKGPDNWGVYASFADDTESKDVADAIKQIRPYRSLTITKGIVRMRLLNGSADAPAAMP